MKLVVGMQVFDEVGRYIDKVIDQINTIADYAIIMDDASTDNTPEYIQSLLTVPHHIVINKDKKFNEEYKLRQQLWNEVTSVNPDWVWIPDADEIIHPRHLYTIRNIMNETSYDSINVPLYDIWKLDDTGMYYRDDRLWCAHNFYSRMFIRYLPIQYTYQERNHHVSRYPYEAVGFSGIDVNIPYLHLGWSREEDRRSKYSRYMKYDPQGKWGSLEQYKSILDPNPNIVRIEDV